MSYPAPRHRYTFEQYLVLEEDGAVRHEFFDGDIYALAGGTPEHAALAAGIIAELGQRLASGHCRVFTSDLRVRVSETGLTTYPDVTVVCGPLESDPADRSTVLNPTLVVEVLSPGTEAYDRGAKLEHYRRVPALRECVLVTHDRRCVEVWRREPGGEWSHSLHDSGEVELRSLDCRLGVESIYSRAGL